VGVAPLRAIVKVPLPSDDVVTVEPPEDPVTAERWGSGSVMPVRLIFAGPLAESSSGECARNHDFVSVNVGGAADGRPSGTA
jgi:hypothetical protein